MATAAEVRPERFRVDVHAYHRMADAGIFDGAERVELIEGEIIRMPPIGPRHVNLVNRLTRTFVVAAGDHAVVSVRNPVLLPEYSEPEPDLVLFGMQVDARDDALPEASDVLLVIEVADSTLRHDRDVKVPLYASHGIPEVWIVDVRARRVVRFRQPVEGGYASSDTPSLSGPLAPSAAADILVDLSGLFGASVG